MSQSPSPEGKKEATAVGGVSLQGTNQEMTPAEVRHSGLMPRVLEAEAVLWKLAFQFPQKEEDLCCLGWLAFVTSFTATLGPGREEASPDLLFLFFSFHSNDLDNTPELLHSTIWGLSSISSETLVITSTGLRWGA